MTINQRLPLLRLLADGAVHSGQSLARQLGVTRSAVWKQLRTLQNETGLSVTSIAGRGYRLERSIELLDQALIRAHMSESAARTLDELQVHALLDSTNSRAAATLPHTGRATAVLCELQTAGRGRRGRRWISGFADSLTLSLAFRFDLPLSALAGVSLASGVAVANTLSSLGLEGHGLKWPNDLVCGARKLAGLLVEASGEVEGPSLAVIGLGLNWRVDASQRIDVDQPWIDLSEAGLDCSRNLLAGRLVSALLETCIGYQREGLSAYLDAWRRHDRLIGRQVVVRGGDRAVSGRYLGLDHQGALILDSPDGQQVFAAGEVSLREGAAS